MSYASLRNEQVSMVTLTVSFNRFGNRYVTIYQTNKSYIIEIITEVNWSSMLGPLAQ